MAVRKVGYLLTVDGVSEFKAQLKNAQIAVESAKSGMAKLDAQYAGNANSVEALNAKLQQQQKIQSAYNEKVKAARAQLEAANTAYKEMPDTLKAMNEEYEAAKRHLDELNQAEERNEKAIKSAEKAVEESKKVYEAQNKIYNDAPNSLKNLETQLTKAEVEQIKAAKATGQFAMYLKEAETSADGTATSIDEFGRRVRNTSTVVNGAADEASIFKGVLSGNLVSDLAQASLQTLVEGMKAAISVGSEFEASMSKVAALSGADGSVLDSLNEKALVLGKNTQFSASQVADAFGYMSLAGWGTKDMLDGIDGVLNLAAASGMDLANASDMLTDYLSAFNLSAKDAAKFSDLLAYAQAHSNTTAEQLGEAYKNCAANLNGAGQDIETVTSLLEAMANQGLKGSEAGTSLNAIVRDMTSKMQDGAIAIGETSVAVADANGNYRDMTDIMTDIQSAVAGMGETQRAAALATTFTSDSTKGLNLILNEGIEKISGYEEALRGSAGAAQSMANTMNDNLKGDMKELSSAAEGLGNAVYDIFNGPLRGAAQLATDALNGVTDAVNAVTEAVQGEKTVLDGFVGSVDDSIKTNEENLKNTEDSVKNITANYTKIDEYIKMLDGVRGKTNMTAFETYQLNGAYDYLANNLPGFTDAFQSVDDVVNKTGEDYKKTVEKLKNTAEFDEISAQRQKLINTAAESTVNRKSAESAINEAKKQLKELEKEQEKYAKKKKEAYEEVQAGKMSLFEYDENFNDSVITERVSQMNDLQNKISDYEKTRTDAAYAEMNALTAVKELDAANAELYESTGHVIDENGNLVSSINDISEATQNAIPYSNDFYNQINGISSEKIVSVTDDIVKAMESVANYQQTVSDVMYGNDWLTSNKMDALIYTDEEIADKKYEILENEVSNLLAAKEYSEGLEQLAQRGVSEGLLNELASLGLDGVGYIQAFVAMTDSELAEYQKYWDEAMSYAEGTNQRVSDTLNAYASAVMNGVQSGYDAWYNYGIQTTQGLFDALASVQAALDGNSDLSFADYAKSVLSTRTPVVESAQNSLLMSVYDALNRKNDASVAGGDIVLNATVDVDGETLGNTMMRYTKSMLNRTGD